MLTILLSHLRGQLNLTADALTFLVAVIAVALAGGMVPAVLEMLAASLLLDFYFIAPVHTFRIMDARNAAALGIFVAVSVLVSLLADSAVRQAGQAATAAADGDLLASAAASMLTAPDAVHVVMERAREAFGVQSVTLLECTHGAAGPDAGPSTGWLPVAICGSTTPCLPESAALQVTATESLRLELRGRVRDAIGRASLAAFAALAATALRHQRLASALEAARPAAEADRTRAALLAVVSHDVRTPLAAAKFAISGLLSRDIQLTAVDRDDLLATADESLDLLSDLAASLLDISRLQAGALPVFPRPADLEQMLARSLHELGSRAQAVIVRIPPDLPQVMADPPILERVIINVTGNALRYSPDQSPPLLTACHRGDRVELRVVDQGPGVHQADRDRMFAPFQRLGETDTTGVGLGLALSRGLTEAMSGTLEPEETPGGGLTMAISLPVAPTSAPALR
jgi:two-component system sensor histidine kinase KdpD